MIAKQVFQEKISSALENMSFPIEPEELYEPIRYTLSMGGKRLRPQLTLMSCSLFSDDIQAAVNPALGIEIFHNFTLLHDDIMDEAPLRRGKATVHTKWNSNIAILSGDVMFVEACRLMSKAPDHALRDVLDVFYKAAVEVCEGQQYDMNFELRSDDMETVKALEKELGPYSEILSSKGSDGINKKAIRLIITGKNGNTPEYISSSAFVFTEVPFNKTSPDDASIFKSTAGMRFKKVYDWDGNGSMPNMQYHSFSSMIKVAQKSGRKVRVYDIPEVPNAFDLFLNAGADYLQVNDLDNFVTYWRNRKPY